MIVDTLARVRPPGRKNDSIYLEDYSTTGSLKGLADRHNAAILIVHHQRKAGYSDILDSVSGTTGVTGAADTVWVLNRSRGEADAELFATGRDFEEKELALVFDRLTTSWHIVGAAQEYRLSRERREILRVLKEASGPLSPKEIALALGRPYGAVAKLLHVMVRGGAVKTETYGKYTLP